MSATANSSRGALARTLLHSVASLPTTTMTTMTTCPMHQIRRSLFDSPERRGSRRQLSSVALSPSRYLDGRRRATTTTGTSGLPVAPGYRRSIFIQTETTPNADALKFLPNQRVLPEGLAKPFVEYLSARATISPPHPSPLAAKLMNIDGVVVVGYGADFITVIKAPQANWAHIRPEVFALITEAITSGETIVKVPTQTQQQQQEEMEQGGREGKKKLDSLAYDEDDDEVVGMIKELLETRIRPAIQEDGGDVEFLGLGEDGFVNLKLRGACRTCDSSTVTLKNGIEGMLMHYVEEVKGVRQVLDEEEEISLKEFAKFEEKLRQQS